MKSSEFINEGWSQKYKSSINCSHPKGFSQKAHCAGKKKHNESVEMEMVCEMCGMCQTHGDHMMETTSRLDAKCWKGMHKAGTKIKGGVRVNNCVPNESVEEGYSYTGQISDPEERSRIHDLKKLYATFGNSAEGVRRARYLDSVGLLKASKQEKELLYRMTDEQGIVKPRTEQGVSEGRYSEEEANAIFDDFEQAMADRGLTEDVFNVITDEEIILETAAWRRSAGKSKKGGLNAKGVASYRRENPGSKLQMAVTTKPSKLKAGSKAAKRRKSFCARMGGVKGPMKKPNGKPTRKALALRKWNC